MEKMTTESNIENQLKEGEAYFSEGNIEEAEKLFLSIIENNPDNKEAYNNLGVISFQNREIEKAINYFDKSLKLDQFYKDAVLNYTCLLNELNLLHKGVPYLEKIVKAYPEDQEISQILEEARNSRNDLTFSSEGTTIPESDQSNERDLCTSSKNGTSEIDAHILSGKKILHAPFEIAGNMARITKFLRLQNVDATSANYYDTWLKYNCDINLKVSNLSDGERLKVIDEFARNAIEKYDIFHFHFALSLYPDFRDLELLKEKGKKILFSFWGSDQRSPEWIFYQQARFLGYRPPKPYFITINQYHVHKMINRYADVMIGSSCIPRGIWIPGQIDISEWSLEEKEQILRRKIMEKDPQKAYFLHAPSENWKKGSAIICKLLEECKAEGMPIEILYVNKMAPEKAREIYAYTDYAIDQVGVGTFGLFGIEMLCWEIPVLAYQTTLWDKIRNNPPVIKITKQNFKQQMEKCIERKKSPEYEELAVKSRQWVHENADFKSNIDSYLRVYRDLMNNKKIMQIINESWYQQEFLIQSGFKSEFYKYMTENKVFKEMQLKIDDYDKRLYV